MHREHMLRHAKNFFCGEPGCKEAFAFIKELESHRRTMHKIGVTFEQTYQCAASECHNKDKIWPRLDNYKQHILRMHKDQDLIELIRL